MMYDKTAFISLIIFAINKQYVYPFYQLTVFSCSATLSYFATEKGKIPHIHLLVALQKLY